MPRELGVDGSSVFVEALGEGCVGVDPSDEFAGSFVGDKEYERNGDMWVVNSSLYHALVCSYCVVHEDVVDGFPIVVV